MVGCVDIVAEGVRCQATDIHRAAAIHSAAEIHSADGKLPIHVPTIPISCGSIPISPVGYPRESVEINKQSTSDSQAQTGKVEQ